MMRFDADFLRRRFFIDDRLLIDISFLR